MKQKIAIALTFMLLTFASLSAFAEINGSYGLHLFFNEKEFIDVLKITTDQNNRVQGEMIVPSDFTGKISNAIVTPTGLIFDLLVPKNNSRPEDLIFHYDLKFFDNSHQQFIGYATLKGTKEFIASFVGFKRAQ